MKKIIYSLITIMGAILLLNGCQNSPKTGTVMSNVLLFDSYFDDYEVASPSIVMFFPSECKNFDKDKSIMSMGDRGVLTMPDGKRIKPIISSSNLTGVNTFKDIQPGEYVLIGMHKPKGFSWPMHYYFGYRYIKVTKDLVMADFKFKAKDMGHFVFFED